MNKILIFGLLLNFQMTKAQLNQPEIYGHRGFRGKFPENSILGFQKAIELGITGIELDVVVNKDKQLVISHEPFFQKEYFCQQKLNLISYLLLRKELAI